MKRLLFIGNFDVEYSTESHLKKTFEKLGWEVEAVQENNAHWPPLEAGPLPWKLLLYVHTHGWGNDAAIDGAIRTFSNHSIPTASFHLDRYWGLNQLDRREERVGLHPFWHTDFVFTADGGNQDKFKERGVNHYWLKPGVLEEECYLGDYRQEYACDVGFVGSKQYHPEHSYRTKLVEWLEDTYGARFKRFAGDAPSGTVRGKDLNDVYASAKVTVGDHCFSLYGSDHYWSDRYYEAPGRGGFLIYPDTDGLDNRFVPTYQAGDFQMLKDKISYYLSHDKERRKLQNQAHNWVKKNATYTNRVKEMLGVIGA